MERSLTNSMSADLMFLSMIVFGIYEQKHLMINKDGSMYLKLTRAQFGSKICDQPLGLVVSAPDY
uniref:Uncharacterized protein n=1 Tax=Timema monikensis TaxID=170555 RepID=A0A7R9HRD6_9NEOP|nr:unnamed protein product [Timema monikensis]